MAASGIVAGRLEHQRVDRAGVPLVDVVEHVVAILLAEVDALVGHVGDALQDAVVGPGIQRTRHRILRCLRQRVEYFNDPAEARPLFRYEDGAVRCPAGRVEGGVIMLPARTRDVSATAVVAGGAIPRKQQFGAVGSGVVAGQGGAERRLVGNEHVSARRVVGEHVEHR